MAAKVPKPQGNSSVQRLAQNIMFPRSPFVLPRIVPTKVAPKLFMGSISIPGSTNANHSAIRVNPNPVNFVEVFNDATSPSNFAVHATTIIPDVKAKFVSNIPITFDTTFKDANGSELKTSTIPSTSGYHYANGEQDIKPGYKFYPGLFTSILSGDKFVFNITQNNIPVGSTVTCHVYKIQYSSGGIPYSSGGVTVAATWAEADKSGKVMTVTGYTAAGTQGLAFDILISVPVADDDEVLNMGANLSYTDTTGVVKLLADSQSGTWNTYSLFDQLNPNYQANCRNQFYSSKYWCVTGMSILVENGSQNIVKQGHIWAARLNDDADLGVWNDIQQELSTYVAGPSYKGLLEKGMHWFYTPRKFSDLEFSRSPRDVTTVDTGLPYMLSAYETQAAQNASDIVIHYSVNLELLSDDPSLTYMQAPSIFGLYEGIVSALASVDPFCENPEHLKHIARQVKRFMTSPQVVTALKLAAQSGIKIGAFALNELLTA